MKKLLVLVILMVSFTGIVFAGGGTEQQEETSKITFYMAMYDGIRDEYLTDLENAFEAEYPEYDLDIVRVVWDVLEDKLTTALAAGNPPDGSVVGTRWLLEYIAMDAIVPPDTYLSNSTLNNIAPGAMEAKIDGTLWGLPVAAGARFMAYNANITTEVPGTMEELRELALEAKSDGAYGIVMPGAWHTELTDFCYYFYAAGGDYFDANGKSTVNSNAGVKALEFMVQLVNDGVLQDGFMSMDRLQSHPVFFAGNSAYVMIGAWAQSTHDTSGADWPIKYCQIPPFEGNDPAPLVITDSIAFFKDGDNLEGLGKFIDFWYQDEWKPVLDKDIGFPPVTISAADLPEFQSPMYQAMAEANLNAKGWPLMEGWAKISDIIWEAVQKAFLGEMSAKEALDEAAAAIDAR